MNKTKIEWVKNPDGSQGYTWNPITGCLNHDNGLCKGGGFPCYAYKLANGRLKPLYLANENIAPFEKITYRSQIEHKNTSFYPRFWEERLFELSPIAQTHKGIFVCDMSDLFGIGIPEEWTLAVLGQIRIHPEHRFYLLTKQPQNLIKFSPFPDNCYVGVTTTNSSMYFDASVALQGIQAKVKFISFEPLLKKLQVITPYHHGHAIMNNAVDWLIIGACTGSASGIGKIQRKYPELSHKPYKNQWTAQPRIEWVREIVEAADKAGIRVFLKDNILPLLKQHVDIETLRDNPMWLKDRYGRWELRQEMPT